MDPKYRLEIRNKAGDLLHSELFNRKPSADTMNHLGFPRRPAQRLFLRQRGRRKHGKPFLWQWICNNWAIAARVFNSKAATLSLFEEPEKRE
jgi:hypothetical protein